MEVTQNVACDPYGVVSIAACDIHTPTLHPIVDSCYRHNIVIMEVSVFAHC